LRSTDVLHDFAVAQFRVKMDLVPGLVTYQWFTPTVPGTYEILLGTPLLDFINNQGGGIWKGRKLKACIPGGSSVPILTAEDVAKVLGTVTSDLCCDLGPRVPRIYLS